MSVIDAVRAEEMRWVQIYASLVLTIILTSQLGMRQAASLGEQRFDKDTKVSGITNQNGLIGRLVGVACMRTFVHRAGPTIA